MTDTEIESRKRKSKEEQRQLLIRFVRTLVRDQRAAFTNDKRFRDSYKVATRKLHSDLLEDLPEIADPLDNTFIH
jgi:hypothetical protein